MRIFIDEAMEWVDLKAFSEWWIDWLLTPTHDDYEGSA